ncbi:uncharacterized protein LOC113155979 [Anabas testudineus]|uniref:uncharacterized protein LOC113155979 n=1 Tax=Anabas testudineus TaxID=64144 RepID=UPI000E45526E|nr:uncharacterized protein LOC113155979 [Anabas testudineus]
MKGHWWSCVLGLLCMPAEVILDSQTVFQSPSSTFQMKVNSSAEITCSTSLPDVLGLYLQRKFHRKSEIVYLSLHQGKVTKNTTAEEFIGRIQVTPNMQGKDGFKFTLRLSLLGLDDTDLYYCRWSHFNLKKESLISTGTIVIVREYDPQEQCKGQVLDHILITLTVVAFTVILFLFIGTLIFRYRRFKKHFTPARTVNLQRPARPQYVYPQQSTQHYPYLVTSENDFRGIL